MIGSCFHTSSNFIDTCSCLFQDLIDSPPLPLTASRAGVTSLSPQFPLACWSHNSTPHNLGQSLQRNVKSYSDELKERVWRGVVSVHMCKWMWWMWNSDLMNCVCLHCVCKVTFCFGGCNLYSFIVFSFWSLWKEMYESFECEGPYYFIVRQLEVFHF